MSENQRSIEERLRALGASAVPVEVRDEARRAAVVRAIEKEILEAERRRTARRRLRRVGAVALAALVLLGVGVGSWKLGLDMGERSASAGDSVALAVRGSSGAVVVKRGASAHLLEQHRGSLSPGDQIETLTDGRLELVSEHSRFQVERGSQVELVGASHDGERLRLSRGHVDVEVRHAQGRRVVIETPHGDVLVVGTAFGVTVEGEGAARTTRVEVQRGTVWILQDGERRAVVEAGQRWTSEPPPPPAVQAEPEREAEPERGAEPGPVRSTPSVTASPAPPEAGTLAEENRLFRAALDARNRGDNARAAELFGELLRRFPGSVVAEEASLGRLRALERLGRHTEAQREAKRYLARFPRGHARAEAERVLAASSD